MVDSNSGLLYAQKLKKDKHCQILTDSLYCKQLVYAPVKCSQFKAERRKSELEPASVRAAGAHRVVEKEKVRLKVGINIENFHLLEMKFN